MNSHLHVKCDMPEFMSDRQLFFFMKSTRSRVVRVKRNDFAAAQKNIEKPFRID